MEGCARRENRRVLRRIWKGVSLFVSFKEAVMTTRCFAIEPGMLAGAAALMAIGCLQLYAPQTVHAQAGSSKSPRPVASATTKPQAARKLFLKHCSKCHGTDG